MKEIEPFQIEVNYKVNFLTFKVKNIYVILIGMMILYSNYLIFLEII